MEIDLNQYPVEEVNCPTNPMPQPQHIQHPNKKKNLSLDLKRSILQILVHESKEGKLPKGVITRVANHFSVGFRSVSRIWHDAKNDVANNSLADVSSRMVNKAGRKRVQIDLEKIKDIPLNHRSNIRATAKALNLAPSTVHKKVKEGNLRPHSNALKPYLTDAHKKQRLEFCLSMIDKDTIGSQHSFINMYDRIHVDEKWFFMSKTTQKYYLHVDEPDPVRTCQSKRFIPKIMFLAAVARPRFDATTNTMFDGKIGVWPFLVQEPAKRNSKNRPAGTLEMKAMQPVTKHVTRSYFIEKLLPAIKEKWPAGNSSTIYIQQDNAKPHISEDDEDFLTAAQSYGLDVRISHQPPQSPDLNALDLAFFRSIDQIQNQHAPSTVEQLVTCVEEAFNLFPVEDSNNVFLTLQSCIVEVLKNFGGNNYKIPHMNKKRLIRNNQLPICIECDAQVLNDATEALREMQRL